MEIDFGIGNSGIEFGKNDLLPSLDRLTIQVMKHFEAISEKPRRTGYTEKIVQYLKEFANDHNLACESSPYEFKRNGKEYKGENVWMDLPATKGCENYPPVILQAHSDMVAEWDKEYPHSFENDPIKMKYDGDKVTADHTTLGADNGIGMALMLAIAESDAPHGPIRLLFTGDEEWNCQGASHLDPKVLNAGILVNLDSEDIDEVCYSSAGGVGIAMTGDCEVSPVRADETVVKMSLEKLRGGHSGVDIGDDTRMHCSNVMMEVVKKLWESGITSRFVDINLGENANSIPSDGYVSLAIPKDKLEEANKIFDAVITEKRKKYVKEEKLVATFAELQDEKSPAVTEADSKKFIEMFSEIHQGVYDWVGESSLPETSSYMGRLLMKDGKIDIGIQSRSFVDDKLTELDNEHSAKAKKYGMEYTSQSYGAWFANPDSDTVKLMAEAYDKADTDVKPKIVAIHAGLECSRFISMKKDLQMVSLGPTIKNVHSTKETLYLNTVSTCAKVLYYFLENVNRVNTSR